MNRRYVVAAGLCVGAGALMCALVVAVLSTNLSAGPGDETRARIDTQLAVQKALQEGLDQLQRGNFPAAIAALEKEIARIDGNAKYLDALATAYRGYVHELQQANRGADAEVYRKRLAILDRSADALPIKHVEKPAPVAVSPTDSKPVAALPPSPEPEKPTNPQPIVARGKIDETPVKTEADRVSEPVRKNSSEAATLIEHATQEFSQKHYAEAGQYYEQAHKVDSGATAGSLEQWAFCKVYSVSAALQHGSLTAAAAQDLEREIQQALAMAPNAPKLDGYAKSLLKALEERTSPTAVAGTPHLDEDPTLEMRHVPAQGDGWATVETKNFRIWHNQPKEVAERAARVAEATRLAMSRKWFGDDGETWAKRCDVYLFATADDYSRGTNTTSRSPGHSTMDTDNRDGHIVSRRIDLHVDHPETFGSVLPHEATHVVLAGRFDSLPVPRWADEGMAVLTEPPHRVERYLRNLPRLDQDHMLFEVGKLMRMNDYPEARLVDPFYTQGVSLVDFLSKEKGPQAFTAFLREGMRSGYEPALRKHYKIESFAELERRWRAFAFAEPAK